MRDIKASSRWHYISESVSRTIQSVQSPSVKAEVRRSTPSFMCYFNLSFSRQVLESSSMFRYRIRNRESSALSVCCQSAGFPRPFQHVVARKAFGTELPLQCKDWMCTRERREKSYDVRKGMVACLDRLFGQDVKGVDDMPV